MYVWGVSPKSTFEVSKVLEARRNHTNSQQHPINLYLNLYLKYTHARLQLIAMLALFIQKANKRQQYLH